MKLKISLICFIICINLFGIKAQEAIEIPKNSISANLLGTGTFVGITYERLLYQCLNLEVGLGYLGYGFGATVYPFKVATSRSCLYVGIKYTDHGFNDREHKQVLYLPVGVTYFKSGAINIGIDIGPAYIRHLSADVLAEEVLVALYPFNDFGFYGNLKVGFRF